MLRILRMRKCSTKGQEYVVYYYVVKYVYPNELVVINIVNKNRHIITHEIFYEDDWLSIKILLPEL